MGYGAYLIGISLIQSRAVISHNSMSNFCHLGHHFLVVYSQLQTKSPSTKLQSLHSAYLLVQTTRPRTKLQFQHSTHTDCRNSLYSVSNGCPHLQNCSLLQYCFYGYFQLMEAMDHGFPNCVDIWSLDFS